MARGRIISTQVASDQQLNNLSPEAERLYLRTLPHLDRDGLVTGHPMLLWAKVAPLRMELMDKCNALIQEWVQHGLVISYPGADGMPVLYFKGFRRHNANIPYPDEAPSQFPPPPGFVRGNYGLIPEDEEARFRLAALFDRRSSYRQELEKATFPVTGIDQVATSSRPHREKVEYKQQDQGQDQGQDQDQCTGDDGDQTLISSSPTVGYSNNRRYVDLADLIAEFSDDELRIAVDAIAANFGIPQAFNGWARQVSTWSRADLTLVLANLKTWEDWTEEQFASIRSLPALLRAAVTSRTYPHLRRPQVDELANQIEDAIAMMSIPVEEL